MLTTQLNHLKRPFWLNGRLFVYELSGCGFESFCSHLNFRFCTCFKQGVPWHSDNYREWIHSKMRMWHPWRSGNYRVWIHSETPMWHDKNIQSNAPYRQVLTTQLNHLKRPVWLNGWVFVYELSGCGFESSCSQFLALELLSLIQQIHDCGVVVNGVVAVTTAQHHSTKPQLRFCTGSNLSCTMLDICDGENLLKWSQMETRLHAVRW